MRIAIGTDHAGYELKQVLAEHLRSQGHEVIDHGTHRPESVDYPDFILPAAEAVARGESDLAIVLGGSGNGEAIAANKVVGIRCAVCWNEETGQLARQHNNANMLSIGARVVGVEIALEVVTAFLSAEFEGGRHATRVDMITAIEG